jgi:sulfoxide reductase heme-binding subunit YedZ
MSNLASIDRVKAAKLVVFILAVSPALWLAYGIYANRLGADPIDTIIHETGWWALLMLTLTLAMTPLRRLLKRPEPLRFRRMLGLYTFFYASLHIGAYVGLDLVFEWQRIASELVKRPYIAIGFAAWLLLLPLAITSTRGMMRRLGRRWTQLHRLVYLIAALALTHFWWQLKSKTWYSQPMLFTVLFLVLMAMRIPRAKNPEGRS